MPRLVASGNSRIPVFTASARSEGDGSDGIVGGGARVVGVRAYLILKEQLAPALRAPGMRVGDARLYAPVWVGRVALRGAQHLPDTPRAYGVRQARVREGRERQRVMRTRAVR